MRNIRNKVLVGLIVVGTWQFISFLFPYYLLPGVFEIVAAIKQAILHPAVGSTYFGFVLDTFRRLFIGFLLALAIGGVLGIEMGLHDRVESFFRVWLVFGLSIPALAIAFVLILIYGISELVPILTVIFIGTPFVMLNMWEGAQALDTEVSEMADFFGASRYQKFIDVIFPQLLPYWFVSMFWGFVISWKVLFVAEVFGAGSGIGYMVNYWFTQGRIDMLLAWVLPSIVIIVLILEGIRRAEDWIITWR
jgi:NitT/TauT family transport system permease protein